jgi:hypothetical protein
MTLKEALYTYLVSQSSVVALVATRIYPEVAPTPGPTEPKHRYMPYVTYTGLSDVPVYHFTGPAGIANAHVQLDVFAETEPARTRVATALQTALERWVQTRPLMEDLSVRFVGIDTTEDAYVPPSDGSERGDYQRSLDVNIWYKGGLPLPAPAVPPVPELEGEFVLDP